MCFLEQGSLRALRDFSPSRRSVTNCFLGDYGPSCLEIIDKILPCSPGLIPHRSHDHWNSTRWDLAWSPRLREIDSYFVFLPFAYNHTNCCHLLTKLLGDGLVAHSSLVLIYNLVPDIIGQLFGLGHGGEIGIWLIDCFCGQTEIRSAPFKRVLLISAHYLYKRHLGARNLAVFEGIKYLFHSLKCKSIYNVFEMFFWSFLLLFCLSLLNKPTIKMLDW